MTIPCYKRSLKRGIFFYYSGQYMGIKYHSKAVYRKKRDCEKAERDRKAEIEEEVRRPRNDVLITTVMNDKLDDIEIKRSSKYYKETKRYYKLLKANTGEIPIVDVTKEMVYGSVREFAADLKKRGKTYHKVNAMIRIYRALFNHAVKRFDIDLHNPMKGFEPYPVNRRLKYIPSDKEIDDVLKLCDNEQALLIKTARDTGARIDELLRLRGEDITEDYVVLYTKKSKNSDYIPRKVPRPKYLKAVRRGRIFKRWAEYPRFLEKKQKKLEVEKFWGFHNLRHRYASLLSKEGKPLFEIMSYLGHSSVTTTQRYLQMLE